MIDLLNGDCLTLMKDIPNGSVDLVLTDLPYGTTACKWDSIIPFEPMWEQLNRIIKPNGAICLFGSEPFSSALRMSNIKNYRYDWYWEKERLTNVFQVKRRPGKVIENILVFYNKQCVYNPQKVPHEGKRVSNSPSKDATFSKTQKGDLEKIGVMPYIDDGTRYPTQVLRFNRDNQLSLVHETQKPVALLEYLICTYTNDGETVLDFTMGSGSTGVACVNTGRNFIGIELDEGYFQIAKKRIESIKEQEA